MPQMKSRHQLPKHSTTERARQPKRIKPPTPSKPVKPKAQPRSTDSRRGALGASSTY
jgi:hypothetical protein